MNQRMVAAGMTVWIVGLAAPGFAQHEGHQMSGMASAEQIVSCGRNSQAVSQLVDASNARIEDARQGNDPATMRSAVADLQVALARIEAQLADCRALSAGMSMSGSMPGMQHAMPAAAGTGAPVAAAAPNAAASQTRPAPSAPAQPAARLDIALVTRSSPPKTGENEFEVTVADTAGTPVANADVSVLLVMPAMPQMNMPEMRDEVILKPAATAGTYHGTGQLMMSGSWNVTISVKDKGKEIGQKKVTLTAK